MALRSSTDKADGVAGRFKADVAAVAALAVVVATGAAITDDANMSESDAGAALPDVRAECGNAASSVSSRSSTSSKKSFGNRMRLALVPPEKDTSRGASRVAMRNWCRSACAG